MEYFISDLHFGHNNIRKFERTQFADIDKHDQFIIDSINKRVKITDILWILGDVGNPEMLRHLNGTKYLIMGNHDRRSLKEYQAYVKEVYTTPVYYNKRVLLSHEPHPVPEGVLNVHGHLHGSRLNSLNHKNTSIHMVDYKPISATDIQRMISDLSKTNYKFLEEWYADMYQFSELNRDDVVVDKEGNIKLEESKRAHAEMFARYENSNERDWL